MSIDLGQLAASERMIPNAPIEATRSVIVNAPIETVWRLLTEVDKWPRWYSYLKNARLDGAFQAKTALTYGGLTKHRLRIAKVKDLELVMIYGTMMGYTAVTRWDIKTVGTSRTKVTFTESSAGPLISLLYGVKGLGNHLQQWLDALKEAAEGL